MKKQPATGKNAGPKNAGPETRWTGKNAGLTLALVVLGFAIYWRSLWGPFLFDDTDILEAGGSVRGQNWGLLLTSPRLLLILSYALHYWFAGGFNPLHFHVVNVLLHVANALILWQLLKRVSAAVGRLAVWFLPLLFLTSPVETESVAYISSRSEVLAATFYLLALLVFVSSWREQRPWTTALLIAFLFGCSVTSKQHGLTLPGALLLVDYFFLARRDWRQMKRNWRVYAVLGAVMVAGAWLVVVPVLRAPTAGFGLRITPQVYLFTQFRMYFLYLRLLAVPFPLNADYDIARSYSLLDHGSWLALAGTLLLLGAAFHWRSRFPAASFGVLFYFLALFPTSSFYPLVDFAAERRLYLPSIGFFLAALTLLESRWPGRRGLTAALAGVVVVYAAGTHERNRVWQDPLALWLDTSEKSPGKWRVWTWLGREYSLRKQFTQATAAYQRAAELVRPQTAEHAEVLSSLGSTYANRGLYAEAAGIYRQALEFAPGVYNLWTNLAIAELRLGRADGWKHFEKAMSINGLAWEPHFGRGNIYYQIGCYDQAIQDYQRVLQLLPEHPDARYNLEVARNTRQRRGESRQDCPQ